ncbi:MAG: FG-GAP-like repeat-containing protein, partial [Bacteroidota bacterium]|nr:FG-GAP-like repeat-containing protein [Bacteroidota bacterium]
KFTSYGNTNGITLQNLNLGYDPSKPASGYGIWIQNGGQVHQLLLQNTVASNRSSAFTANSSLNSTEVTINNCTFTGNTHGLNLHNITDLTIEGNDLRWNDYGLALGAITLPLSVFHNTIYGNSIWNAFGDGPYELWNHDILQGNYWGLTCDVAAFQAGVTSNLATIKDDYAYGLASGWEESPENKCSLPCRRALQELTMFVDAGLPNLNFGQGYAVAGGQFHGDPNSASYDNILDIVVANDNDYGWLYHGGTSGFTKLDYSLGGPVAPGSGANRGLAVGDVNDDSFPDIMMSHLDHDTVFVYFGNGDGTVTLHQKLYVPRPMAIALGNLNAPDPNNPNASGRDNDLDAFVATGGDYRNYVLHNRGASEGYMFMAVEVVYPQGPTPTHTSTSACMADLDEDGDLDVLVTSYSDGYGSYTPVKPQFLRNNGVGAFEEPFPNLFNVEVRGKDIECGNIDDSGLLDVYLATSDGYNSYIFTDINLSSGSSNIINVGFPGIRCNAVTLQDFNLDGLLDAYVATDVGHYDIVQFNTGTSPWYSTNFNFCNDDIEWIPGSYHKSYSVFPFDMDGDTDIDVYVGVGGGNDVVYRNTLDPPNLAPTAEAGPNQTIECTSHNGMPVTLDGTQSTDPDNDALSYLWKLGSTQIATTATVQLTLGLGSYTYTLTVNDGKGGTDTDVVTIVIKDDTPPVLTMVTGPDVVPFSSQDLHETYPVSQIVSSVSDACDPAPVLKILTVTSDEPVEAPANNQQANAVTLDDININAFCNEVELRRERMTSDYTIPNTSTVLDDDGRAYIITVEARDASGNFTTGQYQVHIQSCNAGGNSQSNSGNGGNSSSNSNAGGSSTTACPVTVSAVQYTATCGMSKSIEGAITPSAATLHPNYPNPFNPTTTLSFSLPYESDMRMLVFDGLGRTVKSWEGRYSAGTHTLVFDAGGLSSGVYFYRLITGSTVQTRKMLLTQ